MTEKKQANDRAWSANDNAVKGSVGYTPKEDPTIDDEPQEELVIDRPCCSYCLCDIPECLVKDKAIGRWFCNGRGKALHSHIIHHLVKSRHMEIELPPQNPYSQIPMTCYLCHSTNIFRLSFVQSQKTGKYFVLCRECCNDPQLHLYSLDLAHRQLIVQQTQMLEWLVRPPSHAESKDGFRFCDITPTDMDLLEETWPKNPNATILDLPQIRKSTTIPKTKPTYKDIRDYATTYNTLVKLEMDYDKQVTESMIYRNVKINFKREGYNRFTGTFSFPISETSRPINIGDTFLVKCGAYEAKGSLERTLGVGEIELLFIRQPTPPEDAIFTVQLVWLDTSFVRMIGAIAKMPQSPQTSTANIIKEVIMGHLPDTIPTLPGEPNRSPVVKGIPTLNLSQVNAVSYALKSPFCMIQGPPGTGKTTTIAALVTRFLQAKAGPVLVCAPSNAAVERVTEAIASTHASVCRVISTSRTDIEAIDDKYALHNMVYSLDCAESRRLNDMLIERSNRDFSEDEEKKFKDLRKSLENRVIDAADVITCTCITSADPRLATKVFPTVIIDEATQAVEPEILIPIMHGSKQVCLVGDHMQLGPVVTNPKCVEAGLGNSIVQRLVQLGLRPQRLLTQYRMHPVLSEFPSNTFYDGELMNGIPAEKRTPQQPVFNWPKPSFPLMFYNNVNNEEEISNSGTSYINAFEATIVSQIVTQLCKAGVDPQQIGIISPYSGQKFYLQNFLASMATLPSSFYQRLAIASVDSFQGGEKDYIIMSCVRCNPHGSIGFLKDYRRLNVALTRAKYGLIIVGCARVLSKSILWYNLLRHCQEQHVLVEGSIMDLKESPCVLQKPSVKQSEIFPGIPVGEFGKDMVPNTVESNFDNDDNDGEAYFNTVS
ncbi:regulator of nonsense transcripts 1, putative [Trichomonas vaginalis G3]|uniref:Regulator of nonsense transcripts 1, putative n=1 Tax=Trichomonas vaginalis (strain ATCC PRA-98 / G3) TaxID=412133 RepID=A2DPW5_TRIV3|nr:DNA2/NAM7 helicase family [Trichomonas vaginalis G3]EAY17561.1 regulator of nonsense transcripts 1, putative [Trichomonas vaginalis G3]KAI5520605.1 DNA2/NAM7 helicase family [Trichomonas vaginalis G3]|eukprot:XP_001329696.1 regulator of nonsense transcripts 1 [Trichomonas vaginalis G3]